MSRMKKFFTNWQYEDNKKTTEALWLIIEYLKQLEERIETLEKLTIKRGK